MPVWCHVTVPFGPRSVDKHAPQGTAYTNFNESRDVRFTLALPRGPFHGLPRGPFHG